MCINVYCKSSFINIINLNYIISEALKIAFPEWLILPMANGASNQKP